MKFRNLKPSEIECRVSQINQYGASLLLYKDARCDMNVLDETVHPENWQRDHKTVGDVVYCGVSILVHTEDKKYEWVTKWDAGSESYTEKEKGQASDSFKRACFNWGIGRELYTAPNIKVKSKDKNGKPDIFKDGTKYKTWTKFNVYDIEYTNNVISYLVIHDQDGEVRFRHGKVRTQTKQQQKDMLEIKQEDLAKWLEFYKVEKVDQLSYREAQFILERMKGVKE